MGGDQIKLMIMVVLYTVSVSVLVQLILDMFQHVSIETLVSFVIGAFIGSLVQYLLVEEGGRIEQTEES